MLELVALLVPVAAAAGWLIGRRHGRERGITRGHAFSADYFRGLNHLLNEQPDEAIEVFIRMLEAEGENVEIHLALGSLFRQRGEVDRSIRIHQNLIARPTLTGSQRGHVLLELGLDYMRSGLYDRAEKIFLDLVEMRAYAERALRELLQIYQQEKEWDNAIDTARRLASQTGEPQHQAIAQFYCERAEEAQRTGNLDAALSFTKRALSSDGESVRASLLRGDLEMAMGRTKAAIRAYRRVADQDPAYMPEVVRRLAKAYGLIGRKDEWLDYLREQMNVRSSPALLAEVADLIRERDGAPAAVHYLLDHFAAHASLEAMKKLVDLLGRHADTNLDRMLALLRDQLDALRAEQPGYRCRKCGFTGRSMHWQCPSCKSWSSIKPLQGIRLP